MQVFENLRQAGALEGIEDAPPGGFTPAMLPALYRRSTQRQGQKQHTTLAQLAAGQRELLEGQAELKQIVVSNCFSVSTRTMSLHFRSKMRSAGRRSGGAHDIVFADDLGYPN